MAARLAELLFDGSHFGNLVLGDVQEKPGPLSPGIIYGP